MDTPRMNPQPQTRSHSTSGSFPTSPEFEFWMVRNPSFPQPNLLSADQLFVDGVLLPLHLLSHHNSSDPNPKSHSQPPPSEPPVTNPEPDPRDGPKLLPNTMESTSSLTSSKRWNIFKKSEKKNASTSQQDKEKEKEKEKEKKKEKKTGNGSTSAELNINIWPFSRSRSAGNAFTRPKMFPGSRKVNSAPCSRSNSAGESKSRKWPSSPSRAGVHLGRSSPVWQVRRGGSAVKTSEPLIRNAEKVARKEVTDAHRSKPAATCNASKVRVLNLNVPMCIGYRNHLSCRSDETSALGVVGSGNGGSSSSSGGGGGGNHGFDNNGDGGNVSNSGNSSSANLFSIRSLFTKKVH